MTKMTVLRNCVDADDVVDADAGAVAVAAAAAAAAAAGGDVDDVP